MGPFKEIFKGCGEKGFTFLEIMIALSILGGVIVTLVTATNYHMSFIEENRSATLAATLARSTLEELRLTGGLESGGGEYESNPGFRWDLVTGLKYQGIDKSTITVTYDGGSVELDLYGTPKAGR